LSAYRSKVSVSAKFVLDAEDLDRWFRPAWRAQPRASALVALPVWGILCGTFWLTHSSGTLTFSLVLVALAVWYLRQQFRWTRRYSIARFHGRNWSDVRDMTFEADEESVRFSTAQTYERIAWECAHGWLDTPEHLLIFSSPASFHSIPWRELPSEDVRTAIRRLLTDRIGPPLPRYTLPAVRHGVIAAAFSVTMLLIVVAGIIELAIPILSNW